jgi:hypothetical protein
MDRCGPGNSSGRLGSNPDRHREKKISSQTLPNSPRVVNADRELLDRRGDVSLFKVSRGRLTRYEIECGSSRWNFNLLFPAIGQFERF